MSGVKSQQQEEDKKPNNVQSGGHINLKVIGQDGSEVFISIKRSTPLKKLTDTYCDRQSLEFKTVRFLYDDGKCLNVKLTPEELERKDGAEINVMTDQHGGA